MKAVKSMEADFDIFSVTSTAGNTTECGGRQGRTPAPPAARGWIPTGTGIFIMEVGNNWVVGIHYTTDRIGMQGTQISIVLGVFGASQSMGAGIIDSLAHSMFYPSL